MLQAALKTHRKNEEEIEEVTVSLATSKEIGIFF